jgi:hypothetical protein
MSKEILKKWGENTAYAAKCRFKMVDFLKMWIYALIIINIVFAILSLIDIPNIWIIKIFSILSLVASILILVHESQRESSTSIKIHMQIGEKYLSLHYDIQTLYEKKNVTDGEIEQIKKEIQKLNKMEKPPVSQIAKWMAKKSIETNKEMHNWWKNGNN